MRATGGDEVWEWEEDGAWVGVPSGKPCDKPKQEYNEGKIQHAARKSPLSEAAGGRCRVVIKNCNFVLSRNEILFLFLSHLKRNV
jgi:hypothetical protein